MKLKRYSQLFEADIKKNKGVPQDYIEGVERKGREKYGYNGPNRMEFGEMMETLDEIFRIQDGKEDVLTEIGKEIIMNQYGSILDDVKLDIKIVKPNDPEKAEMINKMDDSEPEIESPEFEIEQAPIDQDEIDKRKILNNLMQGEAQNVHTLMHYGKDKIDEVDEDLLHYYTRVLEINKKFDWFDQAQMMENPEFASAEEVEWEEDENGETTPVIKVRALDLPMLIHETVKGIYELIMANAIPDNEELARRIMEETDTLKDEKEDIKFGPFIAADIRDYISSNIERKHKDSKDVPNLREFVYSKMVELDANSFVSLIYAILSGDQELSDKLMKDSGIVDNAIQDATDEGEEDWDDSMEYNGEDEEDLMTGEREGERKVGVDDEMLKPKEKSYADMSKSELDRLLNQALDAEDFETVKKIQPYL